MTQFDTLNDLLRNRFSCRAFKPDAVPRADIERVIETAKHAPSWCNAQPWQVLVTEGDATERFRDALSAHAATCAGTPDLGGPEGYPGVYGERRRAVGWQLYEAVGVRKGDREGSTAQMMRNFAFFGAPHVAVLTSPRALGAYGGVDCGGFVLAFTLAAQALGISTIPQAAIAYHATFVRDWFQLPEDRIMICAISFGYADSADPANSFRSARANLDEILEWRS